MRINLKDSNTNTWKTGLTSGFQTARLLLKPYKATGVHWLSVKDNNEALYRFVPDLQADSDALAWFESVHNKTNYIFYSIYIKNTNRPAGIFMFNMWPDKKLRIGALLGMEFWNNGYGTEILRGLISFLKDIGFEHSLYADIHCRNHGAKEALLKAGFIKTECRNRTSMDMNEYFFII